MMKKLSAVPLLLGTLLMGCDPVEAEACKHITEGPTSAVTATNWQDEPIASSTVRDDHRHYDITVPERRYGYVPDGVAFVVSEAAHYAFFLSPEVPLVVTDASGNEIALEERATSSEECSTIKRRYVAPLREGNHLLSFGRGPLRVSLVIEKLAQ